MILEEQRYIHEDLERLEQGISDRLAEEPKHVRCAQLYETTTILTDRLIDS